METKRVGSFLILFAISLFANNIYAQGVYANLNVGYGFGMSTQNLSFFDFYNSTYGNNSTTDEQVNVSLGKGLNVGGALGIMFNENIGAELGVSYLLGGKNEAKDVYLNGTINYTLSSTMLIINPSLILTAGIEGINPYAKFGVVIGSGSVLFEYKDNDDGDVDLTNMKLNGGLALGLNAAIGATFSLNDKMSFFGEINMVNMSYAPKKGEITEATYNGVDELPGMTTREKEIEFVDSYTYNWESPQPDSEPNKELKQKLPYGSLGVNFGIRFGL